MKLELTVQARQLLGQEDYKLIGLARFQIEVKTEAKDGRRASMADLARFMMDVENDLIPKIIQFNWKILDRDEEE